MNKFSLRQCVLIFNTLFTQCFKIWTHPSAWCIQCEEWSVECVDWRYERFSKQCNDTIGPRRNNWCSSHMLYICGNYSWKAESLRAANMQCSYLYLTAWLGWGDLCDNHDATCTVLPRLGLDVTSASFELHRGVSEAGQRTCVTALMWNLKSGFYACQVCESYVRVSSHLLWCGDRIVSFY